MLILSVIASPLPAQAQESLKNVIALDCQLSAIIQCKELQEKVVQLVPPQPTLVADIPIITQQPAIKPVIARQSPVVEGRAIVAQSLPSNSSHEALMVAAGISSSDYGFVEWTIQKESGWNPYAREPRTGACHIEQSLPCGKDHCSVEDLVCQLRWTDNYIKQRYGSWTNEVAFHKIHNWY